MKLRSFLFCLIFFFSSVGQAATTVAGADKFTCPSAGLLGSGLFSKVCWDCLLPISLYSFELVGGGYPKPADAASEVFCKCDFAKKGLAALGLPVSAWFPARVIELVRKPYCSPMLSGTTLLKGATLYGTNKPRAEGLDFGDGQKVFKNAHYWSFPLLAILELLQSTTCNTDGYVSVDMINMSEVDPTWSEDVLGFFMVPESILFGNPIAVGACATECAVETVNPNLSYTSFADSLFWCASCDGGIYPFSGHIGPGSGNPLQASSLMAVKQLAVLHRRGLARKTVGKDNMCGGTIYPFIPKSQYRMSMVFPVAESASCSNPSDAGSLSGGSISLPSMNICSSTGICCHPIGQTYYKWGLGRNIPGLEDQVYMVYRFTDCCVAYQDINELFSNF